MSKKRNKRDASIVAVPQSANEANAMVRSIGQWQREATRIETTMNDAIAQVREEFEARAQPIREHADAYIDAVHKWAEANRDELTKNGKTKTYRLPAGEISWRKTPPACTVRGADTVLASLKRAFLGAFIRTKEEVNKEAIIATAEDHPVRTIPGITVRQREEFIVTPHETELSEVA